MNETTTTAPQAEDISAEPIDFEEDSQAEDTTETAEAPADETQPDPSGKDEPVEADAEAEPEAGTDEHIEWLKSKGIDPSDPQAMSKVASMYREAERAMHSARQEAKNHVSDASSEAANGDDFLALKNKVTAMEFYQNHKGADKYDEQIAQVIRERPTYKSDGSIDIEAAYDMVRSQNLDAEIAAAEKRGREAAKAEIARSSTAATPKGNASSPVSTPDVDPDLEAFNKEFE